MLNKSTLSSTGSANNLFQLREIAVIAVLCLIFAVDYIRVGVMENADRPLIPDIHASLLIFLAIIGWFDAKEFRKFVRSKLSVCVCIVVCLALFVGLLKHNAFELIRFDFKIISWIYGGYALSCLITRSAMKGVLTFFFGVGIYFILGSAARHADIDIASGRLMGGVYWDYSELSLVYLGFVYATFAPLRPVRLGLFCSALILHVYFVICLGGNRSDLLAFCVFCVCVLSSYIWRSNTGMWSGLKVFCIISLLATLFLNSPLVQSPLVSRVMDRVQQLGVNDRTTKSRWDELANFFDQSSESDIIWGRGLGATIWNVDNTQLTNSLHIAIFRFLMTFGAVPFVIIVLGIYIKAPIDFFRALQSSRSMGLAKCQAIKAAYPFILAWLAVTLMSGGIDWYYVMGCGMMLAIRDVRMAVKAVTERGGLILR